MQNAVEAYIRELKYKGLSPHTIKPRKFMLRHFVNTIGKPLAELSRDEVLDWIAAKNLKPITQRNYRYWIQEFLAFHGNVLEIPRLKIREKLLTARDLVTPEEVHTMLLSVNNPRDRALLHLLYETGARAGEILNLRLCDIEFGETLTKVHLTGKTGSRVVPVLESVPALTVWLNHCRPLEPKEVIWQTSQGAMSYSRLLEITRKISRQVLGRAISPHRLRHSCATEYAKSPHFNMPLLCERFGWVQGSNIVRRYFHLAGNDLEQATLAMHGQRPVEPPKASPLTPRVCPRCSTKNPEGSRYCGQCSFVLDQQQAQRIIERDKLIDRFLEYLVESRPDIVRQLAKEMKDKIE